MRPARQRLASLTALVVASAIWVAGVGHGGPASDSRSNDLAHWQTTLGATDVDAVPRLVRRSACSVLSPGVVQPEERALGFRKALRVADPDAHVALVTE